MNIDYLLGKRKFYTFTDIDKDFREAKKIYTQKLRLRGLTKKDYVDEVLGNHEVSYDEMLLLKKWLKKSKK